MANQYKMKQPSGRDILNSLTRVFGQKKGLEVWNQACRSAMIPPGRVDIMPLKDLLTVAKKLEAIGGLAKVVACSISIRLNTFRAVERLGGENK